MQYYLSSGCFKLVQFSSLLDANGTNNINTHRDAELARRGTVFHYNLGGLLSCIISYISVDTLLSSKRCLMCWVLTGSCWTGSYKVLTSRTSTGNRESTATVDKQTMIYWQLHNTQIKYIVSICWWFLHCTLASCSTVYCNRSCLWVCFCVCGCVCVCGAVNMITRDCIYRSSPNWVCRYR